MTKIVKTPIRSNYEQPTIRVIETLLGECVAIMTGSSKYTSGNPDDEYEF